MLKLLFHFIKPFPRFSNGVRHRYLPQRTFITALLILSSLFAHADNRTLTTLTLKNQLPSQVLPVIRPLLSSGSSATEFNNQLILNVTADELNKIQQVLGAIDQRPKQLLITVSTPSTSRSVNRGVDVNGSIGNDNVRISNGTISNNSNENTINRSNTTIRDDQLRVGIDNTTRNESNQSQQQVRAIEGMPAQISIGVTTPITSSYTTVNGQRVSNQDYYPVNQSVNVVARIVDDRVIVDINQQNNKVANQQIIQRKNVPISRNGSGRENYSGRDNYSSRESYSTPTINTQSINTQVSGRLGQWIPLGGIDQSSNNDSAGLSGVQRGNSTTSNTVSIKVDVLAD